MAESTKLDVFSRYVEWEILEFFELPKEDDYHLKSSTFYLTGLREKWWLEIFPNSSNDDDIIKVLLYLCKEASETAYEVNYRMGIRKFDGSEFQSSEKNEIFEADADWGCASFLWSEISSAMDDIASDCGCLKVFCRVKAEGILSLTTEIATDIGITVVSEKWFSEISSKAIEAASQTSSLEGVSDLIENFKDLYLSKRSADIKIIVKGREFLAHTLVLIARSKVFSSMFSNDMVEKNSGIVDITDCDPDSFEDFLLFLYTGNLKVVSFRNAVSLYETADKYDLKGLKEECVRRMINEMNLDSFCDVLHLAAIYDETEIVTAATKFFIANAKSILLTTKWTNFMAENLSLGNELFLKFVDKSTKNED